MAWRDIKPDEEITYDYATTEENLDWQMECRCGSPKCRKIITGDDWKIPELQERYAGHFTQSITAKIAKMRGR